AAAHSHRRDEIGVAAYECVVPDLGYGLIIPVVIGRNRAAADVDALADDRVADIAEVRHLAAFSDAGVLDLDEIADFDLIGEPRPGTQIGERADLAPVADLD